MKLLTTLLTLAVLFAVALGAIVPTASDRHRGPLKPKPSNVPDTIVERLVPTVSACLRGPLKPSNAPDAIAGRLVPTVTACLRGPLKPSSAPNAIAERLVADDANTQLIAEYLQADDNDVQADEATTTTCQKCAQVYKDCKNRCHTDKNGQNCDIVCINIACDASVDGGQCGNTCHWMIC